MLYKRVVCIKDHPSTGVKVGDVAIVRRIAHYDMCVKGIKGGWNTPPNSSYWIWHIGERDVL